MATTSKYTKKRTANDVVAELHKMIAEAQREGSEEGLLLSEDFTGRIDELGSLAAPRVSIPLPLAEAIADKLIEVGDGDGDARGLVAEVGKLGHELRDLILVQHGKA